MAVLYHWVSICDIYWWGMVCSSSSKIYYLDMMHITCVFLFLDCNASDLVLSSIFAPKYLPILCILKAYLLLSDLYTITVDCSSAAKQVDNAVATEPSPGQSVSYECNSGYTLSGQVNLTCIADGTWSDALPTCDRK